MNSIDNKTQSAVRKEEVAPPRPISYREPVIDYSDSVRPEYQEEETEKSVKREESTGDKIKRSFDRYVDKIKDFFR
jgi:cell division protein FtsA